MLLREQSLQTAYVLTYDKVALWEKANSAIAGEGHIWSLPNSLFQGH